MEMTAYMLQDRYQIQRQLGERNDQETLLAFDKKSQHLVVVKLLIFNRDLKWETFKLFEREANTLKTLSHPAIPHYIDYFDVETKAGKGFAFVQNYIDAPSLADHIKAGRTFSETELKQIAKAILEVLNYLHKRYPPIIHRDIKPSNILLENRSGNYVGQVYLVDFGAVQAAASEGGTRTIVGTYGYMAPEQFGERAVPASDLYGLGTTLIYLASGQHPADLPQKNLRVCFGKYVQLSPAFKDWLQWMTEPALEQRLESAHKALEVLENGIIRQPLTLVPVKPQGSKVVLVKDYDLLEVHIPPKGFTIGLLPKIGAVIWCGFVVIWYAAALAAGSTGGWLAAFFSLGYLGVGLWLVLGILFALFGHVRLCLTQEQISLRYELFFIKYFWPRPASRHQIMKLERTRLAYKRGQIKIKPQINIWAGNKKFGIGGIGIGYHDQFSGGDGLLTEIELDWLAHELSDWLDLPVTREA